MILLNVWSIIIYIIFWNLTLTLPTIFYFLAPVELKGEEMGGLEISWSQGTYGNFKELGKRTDRKKENPEYEKGGKLSWTFYEVQ
jgi:hypothetical protein